MPKIERALLSVTDKTDIVDFAARLARAGVELLSTGGTAKLLSSNGIPVREVADITGFPEMLDGRVKTIHPKIAGGMLAIRSNPEHMAALEEHGIPKIDLVVVNLYEFSKHASKPGVTREELIENIDIGGPTMIRAAAKNWQDVSVVVSADQYTPVIEQIEAVGEITRATNWKLAQEAFAHTAAYDAAVSARLAQIDAAGDTTEEALPARLSVIAPRSMSLRYGENPHQQAALYRLSEGGIAAGEQLHGKELSYNNLVDLDAAWQLVSEFTQPACAIIKHTNPCGCAEQPTLADAYRRAYEADPTSAFGGVIAFNRELDSETAEEVAKLFVEAIAAPAFSPDALAKLQGKKNLRLVRVKPLTKPELVIKSITGGLLAQTPDLGAVSESDLQLKTKLAPTPDQLRALLFAWKVCKHVKSNAVVYAREGQLISAGAGQMSRVDSVKTGALKAVLPLENCVVASDAFFPFPDGLEQAAQHGAKAFIQPGGSVRDPDVIAAADRLHLAMVFTGMRHFRH